MAFSVKKFFLTRISASCCSKIPPSVKWPGGGWNGCRKGPVPVGSGPGGHWENVSHLPHRPVPLWRVRGGSLLKIYHKKRVELQKKGGFEAIQHPRFPCSPLPKYWSGPTVLNFAVRMGCGAFTVVWPYDEGTDLRQYTYTKKKWTKCKKSKKKHKSKNKKFFFFIY